MVLALLILLSIASAQDFVRENDITVERGAFESVRLRSAGQTVLKDAQGPSDMVLFDRGTGEPPPAVAVDLLSVEVVPGQDSWSATFRFADALPKEPAYPINFDLFLDRDGDKKNNASNGVFRSGADTAFLLLFGTKTKWHTLTWQYDVQSGRWVQLSTPVSFSVGEREVMLTIPSTLLPLAVPKNATVRAFALTSTGGLTLVDVAPGTGLPSARNAEKETHSAGANKVVLSAFVVLIAGSLALWYRSTRR